jgi:hypothetical protein
MCQPERESGTVRSTDPGRNLAKRRLGSLAAFVHFITARHETALQGVLT